MSDTTKTAVVVGAILVALVVLGTLGGRGMMGGMMGGGWGWGLGWLGMILVWALLVAVAVLVVRALWGGEARPREDSALEILKRRYARGDISKEEFEEKRRSLEG